MMEAPNKESCRATHQEAHGGMPCNIIELKGGDYEMFMGNSNVNSFDIVENPDGDFDTGHRSILVAEIISLQDDANPYKIFKDVVARFNGRDVGHQAGRQKIVFNKSLQAVACANALQAEFTSIKNKGAEIHIGISSGMPVTEHDGIFTSAIQLADCLCDLATDGKISISAQTAASSKALLSESGEEPSMFNVINSSDEKLLLNFIAAVAPTADNENINIDKISVKIGVSKAQLYRKIKALSGYSPNSFIQELKLKNAYQLIGQKFGNVAEIAFASGFNSPSYFSKSFQKRFGKLPAKVLKSV
jgi:AraC-like DNA-binding protein